MKVGTKYNRNDETFKDVVEKQQQPSRAHEDYNQKKNAGPIKKF